MPTSPLVRIDRLNADASRDDLTEPQDPAFLECREIRRIVFTQGQGVSLDLEFDGLDGEAEHFLAWRVEDVATSPVGTARMRRSDGQAKAERVAVVDASRGLGVGRQLMRAIEARARELELAAVVLHAQVSVIGFYENLGYTAEGEIFVEADIDHVSMSKSLSLSRPQSPRTARN